MVSVDEERDATSEPPAIRLGYSSNAFTNHTLPEAIEKVGELGYEGIEILADEPHLSPDPISDEYAEKLRDRLSAAGLEVTAINCNTSRLLGTEKTDPEFGPTLLEPDRPLRIKRRNHILNTLRTAKKLSAGSVTISSGKRPEDLPPEEAEEIMSRGLDTILNVAETLDVRVGLEFEPGHYFSDTDTTVRWLERFSSPYLGLNFDLGHSWIVDGDVRECIRQNVDRIWQVHVEDIAGDKHEHLIPGLGDIPFTELFSLFRELEYDGFFTVELYPYADRPVEAGRKARDHLLGTVDRVGSA